VDIDDVCPGLLWAVSTHASPLVIAHSRAAPWQPTTGTTVCAAGEYHSIALCLGC